LMRHAEDMRLQAQGILRSPIPKCSRPSFLQTPAASKN
jgi:hypothetical protein